MPGTRWGLVPGSLGRPRRMSGRATFVGSKLREVREGERGGEAGPASATSASGFRFLASILPALCELRGGKPGGASRRGQDGKCRAARRSRARGPGPAPRWASGLRAPRGAGRRGCGRGRGPRGVTQSVESASGFPPPPADCRGPPEAAGTRTAQPWADSSRRGGSRPGAGPRPVTEATVGSLSPGGGCSEGWAGRSGQPACGTRRSRSPGRVAQGGYFSKQAYMFRPIARKACLAAFGTLG